jgi:hypothetical protein
MNADRSLWYSRRLAPDHVRESELLQKLVKAGAIGQPPGNLIAASFMAADVEHGWLIVEQIRHLLRNHEGVAERRQLRQRSQWIDGVQEHVADKRQIEVRLSQQFR